jgi:hypothetical protein
MIFCAQASWTSQDHGYPFGSLAALSGGTRMPTRSVSILRNEQAPNELTER